MCRREEWPAELWLRRSSLTGVGRNLGGAGRVAQIRRPTALRTRLRGMETWRGGRTRRECAGAPIIRGIHSCIRCGFPSGETMPLFGVRCPQPGLIQDSEISGPSIRIFGPVEAQDFYLALVHCSLGKACRVTRAWRQQAGRRRIPR